MPEKELEAKKLIRDEVVKMIMKGNLSAINNLIRKNIFTNMDITSYENLIFQSTS